MRNLTAVCIIFLAFVLLFLQGAYGGDKVLSGRIGIAGKYDSNIDLLGDTLPPEADPDDEIEAAAIAEITALILASSNWNSPWILELELFGITDIFVEQFDDTWVLGRANGTAGYGFDNGLISLGNESKYFSEPDDTEFDNLRNIASLGYKHAFSQLWQGRIGYENILHIYPESGFFDHYANGGFVEIRNTWLPAFSTYYGYTFQYFTSQGESMKEEAALSPEVGFRHTGEIGFESFFAKKNTLIGSYSFQHDANDNKGIDQIGEIRGEDENLDSDAEFNFRKHKAMLLYSHRFNDQFTFSLFSEFVHKTYPDSPSATLEGDSERTDQLLLSSVWLTVRLVDGLYSKGRYLYRFNESSLDYRSFQDHIGSFGLEYRF